MNAKQLIIHELYRLKGFSESPETDIRILFETLTGQDYAMSRLTERDIPESVAKMLRKAVDRLINKEPLQYILGEWSFMGNDFIVTPDVLIPRSDTEIVCESAIEYISKLNGTVRVLDMCTGSGCIGISIAKALNNAVVDCADISRNAIDIVKRNAVRNNVEDRVNVVCSDMFRNCGIYDVIVSNPPYIPRAEIGLLDERVRCHEPQNALDGGEDGLDFYRIIANDAKKHLISGGRIFLEIGYDQRESVTELLTASGYEYVTCKRDYSGNDRLIECTWRV